MFDHIDHLKKETSAESGSINLLPDDIKKKVSSKKASSKNEIVFSHPGKIEKAKSSPSTHSLKEKRQPKKSFDFKSLLGKFKFSRRKLKTSSIQAVNLSHRPHQPPLPPKIEVRKDDKDNQDKIQFNIVPIEEDSAPDDIDVNLLPEQKKALSLRQVLIYYILSLAISIVIIVIPYIILKAKKFSHIQQNQVLTEQLTMADTKVKQAQQKINSFGPIATKMENLDKLFANHIYWSHFFPELEKSTLPDVYYTGLDVSSGLTISLHGQASNLKTLAEQLLVFENNPAYSQVKLQSPNLNSSQDAVPVETEAVIVFDISFQLDPSIIHN